MSKEEERSLNCGQIREEISELKGFLDTFEDIRFIASIFDVSLSEARSIVNQAKARLTQLQNLSILRKCS